MLQENHLERELKQQSALEVKLRTHDSKLHFDMLGFDVLENPTPTQFQAETRIFPTLIRRVIRVDTTIVDANRASLERIRNLGDRCV